MLKRLHLGDYAALWICGVLAGTLSGALMNALAGVVSPPYFEFLFYMSGSPPGSSPFQLWLMGVGQGMLEGLVFGLVLATIFTLFTFFVSNAQCRFGFAARYLPKMMIVATFCWLAGGFNGVMVGIVAPGCIDDLVSMFSASTADRLRFLAVGGAIYGVYAGCLLSLILGCAWFRRDWRALVQNEAAERMTPSEHFPTFQRLHLFDTLLLVGLGATLGVPCAALFILTTALVFPELFYVDFFSGGVSPIPSQGEIFLRACGESFVGALYGGAMALVFTAFFSLRTWGQFDWRMVAPFLKKMPRVVIVAWLLGGLTAVSWGCLIPTLKPQWLVAGLSLTGALRALWAIGSLCGAMLGCAIALIMGCLQLHRELKARKKEVLAAEFSAAIKLASN